ncbi:MAG: hypothetical protein Aureis2KO_27490 [Aureisphaera sp.]
MLFTIFQVTPLLIICWHTFNRTVLTGNPGWILDKDGDCKFFTTSNYENRIFTWSGDCIDGFTDGFGELRIFENGMEHYIYEGFISKGIIQGHGKLIVLSDGDTYEGNYQNGKPHGSGHFYNDDGDHYLGNYANGMRSGNGTYWFPPESELFKYVGEWKEGKENGKGTLFYRNGEKISGIFTDGILTKTFRKDSI